ncbi:hypothetical protein MG295_00268 [Bacillus phage vB_BcgM]|nr:hypothetical protein MG295_00268 [Bacillus phage vB_BcgM]
MSKLLVEKIAKMEEALKAKSIHFHTEGNVVGLMANNQEVEITCEVGRYIVVLFDGERESFPLRYKSVNTVMKDVIL